MEATHILFGMIGGERGDDGADQDLRESAGGGEDDGAAQESGIDGVGEKEGREGIEQEPGGSEDGDDADKEGEVAFSRIEGEENIDGELGAEIDKDQRAEQGKGNAVQLAEADEQEGRKRGNHGHGDIDGVAGVSDQAIVMFRHNKNSRLW